jgi:hypothetical protein
MRFMKVHVPYPAYLRDLDSRKVLVPGQPYSTQLQAYLQDGFQQSEVASVGLRTLGWDCCDFVATHAGLCRQWSRERGRKLGYRNVDRNALLAAVREYRPDVLLMYHHLFFDEEWVMKLRQMVPKVRVVAWCGVSVERRADLASYDAVITCNVELVKQFQSLDLNAHHVPFAFDPASRARALRCKSSRRYGVTFLGQVVTHSDFHAGRASLLERIAENCPIDIFSSWRGPVSPLTPTAHRLCRRLVQLLSGVRGYSGQPRFPVAPLSSSDGRSIGPYATIHPPRYGVRYLRTMCDSMVTLNHQPKCAGTSASNMRLIEAAGVGACLLTDYKDDLDAILKPDSEVMVFRNYQECLDKIHFLLRRPSMTQRLRQNAVGRVNRDHNPVKLGIRLNTLFRSI